MTHVHPSSANLTPRDHQVVCASQIRQLTAMILIHVPMTRAPMARAYTLRVSPLTHVYRTCAMYLSDVYSLRLFVMTEICVPKICVSMEHVATIPLHHVLPPTSVQSPRA